MSSSSFHPPNLVLLALLLRVLVHELREEVDGQREDDGGVLLRGDGVQGLDKERGRGKKKQFNGRTHTSCEFPQLDSEKSVKQRCVTINFPTELPKGRSMPIFTISAN